MRRSSISTVGRSGVPAPLDYEITIPSRASLDIGGTYTDISIDGVRGSVSATTVQGEVTLRGGDGVISLKSVEGIGDGAGCDRPHRGERREQGPRAP